MKFLKLHSKTIAIVYRNRLCSFPTLVVILLAIASITVPVFLVTLLSPYSGVSDSKILFEQPNIRYQFKYIFLGETYQDELIVCSTFNYLNRRVENINNHRGCQVIKYWEHDWNYDQKIDQANFEFRIDSNDEFRLRNFQLVLFYESKLENKCHLTPPAVLIGGEQNIPEQYLPNAEIFLKYELELKQRRQFNCPFLGRKTKSHFRNDVISVNASSIDDFDIRHIRELIADNPGYFEMKMTERYFRKQSKKILNIMLSLDINEIPVRYYLSVWEKLGQFWLYFASFFGVSFFIFNRFKDFLFGRHLLRSWEVIPWKKLY